MSNSGAPGGPSAAKDALRLRLTAARARRSDVELSATASALASAARALPPAAVVAAYVGVGTEPPTTALLQTLQSAGVEVLLPVVLTDGLLEWGRLPEGGDTLERGPLGLLEPPPPYLGQEALILAGLVLVPALAVDRVGNRLGRGRGYYDRALSHLDAGVPVLAVVFDDELLDLVPTEPHDRPVSGALFPSGPVRFSR